MQPAEPLTEMTLADLEAVLDVQAAGAIRGLAQVFPQERFPFPRSDVGDRWRRELADPMVDCFVVTSGGAVAGFLAVRRDELLHFGIATDLWGSGLASAAHDAFIDLLARRGLRRTWTLVFRDNPRGRRFYEKLGWEPTGERTQSTFPPHADCCATTGLCTPGRDPRATSAQTAGRGRGAVAEGIFSGTTSSVVEGCPHDTGGARKKTSSFLYNGTRTMYEREGFTYERPKGQGNCVMVREVAASTGA